MGRVWASHAICNLCWGMLMAARGYPHRVPYRLVDPPTVPCCFCGMDTSAGIYVRARNESLRCRGDCQKESE